MSVLIKGMKMPKGCYECPLMDFEYGECGAGATGEYDPYRKDCPLEDLNLLCALADRACPFQGNQFAWCLTCPHISEEDRDLVKKAVSEPKTGEWIPIKWHEITEEEREREGYPKDWVVYIDCDMPNDGDEILVQTKNGYIRWDVCYEDGEFSLDSGWDWIEDIVAWCPLPEPYREDGE